MSACSPQSDNPSDRSIRQDLKVKTTSMAVYDIPLSFKDDYIGLLPLKNNHFIYYNLNNDTMSFYEFDMSTGKSQSIGNITPFISSNDSTVLLGDHLYFYAGTRSSEDTINTNFYEINLETRKLNKLFTERLGQIHIYLQKMEDQALTYKGTVDKNIVTTFIDSYKPSTKKVKRLVSFQYDNSTNQGEFLYNIAATTEAFYALVEKRTTNKVSYSLKKYDKDGTYQQSYILKDFDELIKNSGIGTVKIMGDYVYIDNFSHQSLIGKITGDEVKPVVTCTGGIELATDNVNDATDYYLFEQRDTEHFYALDLRNETWLELPISVDPVYKRFVYTVTDRQGHALIMMKDDALRIKLFYLNVLDFLPQAKVIGKLSPDRVIEIASN